MDRVWSPWRYRFVTEGAPEGECVFCSLARDSANDERNFVVHRAHFNFVVLNLYPYTAGHMLIVPYEHVRALNETRPETTAELFQLARVAEAALDRAYHPDGKNLGMNFGSAAGAGIAEHIHMHVLPRWTGDANFLSTIGETRLLAEDLPVTWRKLKDQFAALA